MVFFTWVVSMIDKNVRKPNTNPFTKFVNLLTLTFKKRSQPSDKPAGATWQDIKIEISPGVQKYLEMRHVSVDEAKQVIQQAENTKEKLYQPDSGRCLAKSRIGKATFYVEYHQVGECFIIDSAYAHKSEIVG